MVVAEGMLNEVCNMVRQLHVINELDVLHLYAIQIAWVAGFCLAEEVKRKDDIEKVDLVISWVSWLDWER